MEFQAIGLYGCVGRKACVLRVGSIGCSACAARSICTAAHGLTVTPGTAPKRSRSLNEPGAPTHGSKCGRAWIVSISCRSWSPPTARSLLLDVTFADFARTLSLAASTDWLNGTGLARVCLSAVQSSGWTRCADAVT